MAQDRQRLQQLMSDLLSEASPEFRNEMLSRLRTMLDAKKRQQEHKEAADRGCCTTREIDRHDLAAAMRNMARGLLEAAEVLSR
jgi:hypothetical protein